MNTKKLAAIVSKVTTAVFVLVVIYLLLEIMG